MPVSINEASDSGRAKVVSNCGDVIYYRSIVIKDSSYYGVKGKTEVLLDPTEIHSIHLKDQVLSKKKTNDSWYIIDLLTDLVVYH